jgi:hypothetical protein
MVPRLGIKVIEVRIIPVEYSDVMLMAPTARFGRSARQADGWRTAVLS